MLPLERPANFYKTLLQSLRTTERRPNRQTLWATCSLHSPLGNSCECSHLRT